MFRFIFYIIHISSILFMLSLGSWECSIVSYYQNNYIILASENQRYNFTFAASIINILNALFLIWVFLDKDNIRLINYLIPILILNLVIGLLSCTLYNHLGLYGRFNDVIIVELNLFIIKCALFLICLSYNLITYMLNKNNNIVNADYSEVLIAEAIN